ncbi:Putative homeodomain-like transcription factor superfamily protein isoform 1 [Zea mays]|uniref:Putative homeodomain-like transcription factor superfamily protein isoform 1 n=1 Tax=Zea mays TaxID=4577 RepID=A0A1D6FLD2_MAIZE|nr:Putative homeodomain-like transcription factor superfamily protein isoform 1 [Zea mays]
MCTPMSPWMGRLRSHHATPQSFPKRRPPSQTKNPEEKEELQTWKKHTARKKTARGRHAGAAAQQPRAFLRGSSRLAGRDYEHPIMIDDDVNEECKSRADQSAITPLRRSPRFHLEDKSLSKSLLPPNRCETSPNRKTKNAHRKDKNQESLKGNRGSAGFPPRKDISDVSNKKSDKQELKPIHCKVQTGKRKRGTERRLLSKKQSCQDPGPLPAYRQEIASCNESRKSTHRRIENDPSTEVKLKVGDVRLANIDENINKPSGTQREGIEIFCGPDDWTKEQDMALRKAYFSARPSPHFWKRVSKMGDLLKIASTEFILTSQHRLQLPHVPEQVKQHFLL